MYAEISALLLLLGGGALLALLVLPAAPADAAADAADGGADGRALAGIAADGAADGAHRRAPAGTAQRATLGGALGVARTARLARGVDAGLLDGPAVAFELVLCLLIFRLALLRIDENLCACAATPKARTKPMPRRAGRISVLYIVGFPLCVERET